MPSGTHRRRAATARAPERASLASVLEDLATLFAAAGDGALRVALATVCTQLGWRYGEAFHVDGDGRLVPGPAWSIEDEPDHKEARVARLRERGENLPLKALAAGKEVWSSVKATSVAVAAPVMVDGRPVAVLHFVLPHIPRPDTLASSLLGAVCAALSLRLAAR